MFLRHKSWVLLALLVSAPSVAGAEDPEILRAAVAGDDLRVAALLAQGVPIDSTGAYGETALIVAARAGWTEGVRLLVEQGAGIDASTRGGDTALHFAARFGHVPVVRILTGNCADPDARNLERSTPLHLAAAGGHSEAVELLLDSGADPEAERRSGATPIRVALGHRNRAVVSRMLLHREMLRATAEEGEPSEGGAANTLDSRPPSGERARAEWIERGLGVLGYGTGTVDGILDGRARDAIARFQRDQEQRATGEPSSCTVHRLRLALEKRERERRHAASGRSAQMGRNAAGEAGVGGQR